ncbi:MAG: TrkH family potassium uptake protein [Firmicutes bacterium]|nr:TrkH family potassium uptake protein [Bacillota bacterium]
MHRRKLFYLLGIMLLFLALMMVLSALWSVGVPGGDRLSFLKSILITAAAGALLFFFAYPSRREQLSLAESFTLVTLAWLLAGFFGGLPFYFYSGTGGAMLDAFFEALSGFTTTGATVIADPGNLPRGLLFWRALTQWLGGMGIIVLFLAVLPRFGSRSTVLYRAELPGPVAERFVPRISETARWLWLIYTVLTFLQTLLLILCGLNLFDALAHAFTTMPTGGFSTYNASVAALNNPAAEVVMIIFMFLAGVNFTIYFRLIKGDGRVLKSEELRFYSAVLAAAAVLIAIDIAPFAGGNILLSIRQSCFQVVSVATTTGYASVDFDAWPHFSRMVLLSLMFLGACGGSTGGGLKQIRLLLLFRYARRELVRLVHPSAVAAVKLDGEAVSEETMRGITGFAFLYILFFAVTTLLLCWMKLDPTTAASAAASALGNVGPGLGMLGPRFTYSAVPAAGKVLLCLLMIMGRLEIYTVLVLFLPESRRFLRNK